MDREKIKNAVETYGDSLYRLCLVMLGNSSDAEDAVQETFMQLIRSAPEFRGNEHEKAWLITVAANKCRDMLRRRKWFTELNEDELASIVSDEESSRILEALAEISPKFREILVLHYVEDYKVNEIAEMIKKSPSAVKMRLAKGRKLLEEKYRKEYL
ncbi:MAG: RNA polymerase sigma factor [Ruminococcus sp.]|nr:RNA polymerase sigma factor [Ruminococcus sp.]